MNRIKSDIQRFSKGQSGKLSSLMVTIPFRICNFLITKKPFAYKLLYVLPRICLQINSFITGIQLPPTTTIGKGLRFAHFSGIVIVGSAVIGNNCTILQNVTIGASHFGRRKGSPTIANNVIIYAGACITGKVSIGSNVVIGANSVVTKDVPDNSIVAGNPARVISEDCLSQMGEMSDYFFDSMYVEQ